MKNKIIIAIASLAAVFTGAAVIAHANPSFFYAPTSTAAATSTVSQIIPGVATTTVLFDSYATGRPYALDSATLFLQTTASSTSSIVNIAYQFSQDSIDWYDNDLVPASSTPSIVQIQGTNSYSWTALNTARNSKAVNLPTPTRYVRAVISAAGANSFIWASIIPKQQSI